MKKALFLTLLAICASFMISCGSPAMKDDSGCFMSMTDAKKAANKAKSNILVIISQEEGEDNGGSAYFVNNILMNENFRNYCKDNFELYRMDYSQKNLLKSRIDENATKKEQELAHKYADFVQEGMMLSQYLEVKYTPAFYIITKDGYLVSEVDYTEDEMNVESFSDLLDSYKSQAKYVQDVVNATKKGSDTERLNAINALFSITPVGGQFLLYDFAQQAVKLDPENKSGTTGKYYYMTMEEKALDFYRDGNVEDAINTLSEAADKKIMGAEFDQQAYYMCAWILESVGAMGSDLIPQYLEKAYYSNPTSETAAIIKDALDYYSVQFKELQNNPQVEEAQ